MREAARAVGKALPYLVAAEAVTIIVVTEPSGEVALIGGNLERRLLSHGVLAVITDTRQIDRNAN